MIKLKHTFLLFVLVGLTNCVSSPNLGALFTNTQQHVYNYRGTTLTSAKIEKTGRSCSYGSVFPLFYVFYYGQGGSVEDAKKKAKITKIATIDKSSYTLFPIGLFYRECTIVWGE
ncbi:MAG: TRL domain-containing protein [Spirochaetota bacterium]